MRAFLFIATVLIATTSLVVFAQAPKVIEEFSGKVLLVIDGDTMRIQHGDQNAYFVVQLDGVATPEKKQPFNKEAKELLSETVLDKKVDVKITGKDKSGRVLAMVSIDKTELNSLLLEKGLAWHNKKYNSDARLAKLEDTARKAKRGLWADDKPIAPWDFRKQQADAESSEKPATTKTAKPMYWLNVNSNVRHNQNCEHFGKTTDGRACTKDEGKPCGKCGG